MAVFTQEQYDQLLSAYAKGVTTVEYADQKVTYRSLKDMKALLNEIGETIGVKSKWNGRVLTKFKSGL
jgi:hypothetical protein